MGRHGTALIGPPPRVEVIFSAVSEQRISHCQTKRSSRCYAAREDDDDDQASLHYPDAARDDDDQVPPLLPADDEDLP